MTRAIYIRTSVADNDGAAQRHELELRARGEGWNEWVTYFDRGESGAEDSRPQWDKLTADVRRGRVRELLVTELSRLGRSTVAVLTVLDEWQRAGLRLIVTRLGIDFATPSGRMVAAVLAAVAELELELTRERRLAGVRRAQAHGTRSGRPIGRPRVEVDADKLKRACQARDAGTPWREVAEWLGVPESTARRVLAVHQNLARSSGIATT